MYADIWIIVSVVPVLWWRKDHTKLNEFLWFQSDWVGYQYGSSQTLLGKPIKYLALHDDGG